MADTPRPEVRTLFGHPLGLYVLFFTELWERFSFYGMKTLLMLYMLKHFFWSQAEASSLMGTYSALAYGVPVVGGFIADRWLGARRAVLLGGILLAIGHFLMAFEPLPFFYSALALIIAGVGFLKPNVSTQVGALYPPGDPRRDGAFTIFYMGINVGALIGPWICDWLRLHYGYHYGFGAAGVGMVIGLIVYAVGQRKLVEFNQEVPADVEPAIAKKHAGEAVSSKVARDRVIVLLVIFLFVIVFWTAFEQTSNVMLVWADMHTNLRALSTTPPPVFVDASTVPPETFFPHGTFGSGQTQSFNPFFIITLAPIFAAIWVWLDRRGLQPSTPGKMMIGLLLVGVAFAIMWPAAAFENRPSAVTIAALPAGLLVDEQGRVYSEAILPDEHDAAEASADVSTTGPAGTNGVNTTGAVGASRPPKRDYYGATRLVYDAESKQLRMNGVLTELDRLRLLAATAPREFVVQVEAFAEQTKNFPSHEDWSRQQALVCTLNQFAERSAEFSGMPATARLAAITELHADCMAKNAPSEDNPPRMFKSFPDAPPGIAVSGAEVSKVLEWDAEARLLTAKEEIKERARVEFLASAADPEFKKAVDELYLTSADYRVSIWWLIAFYMILTMGELCLSPVGLSLVTKLAPPRHVGLLMGGWFLATAAAEKAAHTLGAYWGQMPPMTFFTIFVVLVVVAALILGILVRPLKKMMHGVN